MKSSVSFCGGDDRSLELGIFQYDAGLVRHSTYFQHLWKQYQETLEAIEQTEGSLLVFAKGYKRFGLHQYPEYMIYREWAPAAYDAQMIGDFNNWNGTQMQRSESGIWSCTLPNIHGTPAIQHLSKFKIRFKHKGGWWLDTLPAWTQYAIQQKGKLSGAFDSVYWNPPSPYRWRYERPPRPAAPCIYEAHVGMSSEDPSVATYKSFAQEMLPHIAKLGYNVVQLMAIQEHPYYGSYGYHVSNPFAVSSRCGTPDDLKYLIDEAHRHGLAVILDIVHSHMSKNKIDGLAGFDFGQEEKNNYFRLGSEGYHPIWDSKLLNYGNHEVLRFLLSNLVWWMEEYKFDGFRFDGVTSMLYHHHGINHSFSGSYDEYFSPQTDIDAVVYLMLANKLLHEINDRVITVAEDVSGMPTLCCPIEKGGVGFDYRLAMGMPELWISVVKESNEEKWDLESIVMNISNRRKMEKTVAYVECHDQSFVGGTTLAFRLMGTEMWNHMSALLPLTQGIDRGIALHKIIRMLSLALGGQGWLNFMGNEFGHPDWIDFPRKENGWSYDRCRRLWSLRDASHLRYKYLERWDRAIMKLQKEFRFLESEHSAITQVSNAHRIVTVERGPLVFIFNFSSCIDHPRLQVGVSFPGQYYIVLDSDVNEFDGKGKLAPVHHLFSNVSTSSSSHGVQIRRPYYVSIYSPMRSCIVLTPID